MNAISAWLPRSRLSTYCKSSSGDLQSFDSNVSVADEAEGLDPMEQMLIAERLQEFEGFCVHIGVVEMVCPVTQRVLNMGGEVSADSRGKIGNVAVGERNLIDRNLTHILAKCGGHRFETAPRENAVVLSGMNDQVWSCASSRVDEEVGE